MEVLIAVVVVDHVAVVVLTYVVDVAVVVVVVAACAGPCAGASTGRRVANATRTRQAAIAVPRVIRLCKSIPTKHSA